MQQMLFIRIIIEYAWTCLNKQGSEYASCPIHAKILNMAVLSSEYGRILNMQVLHSILNMPEYFLTEFQMYLGF